MAVVQISRIQHRRGLQQDLPNLASAELGWSVDSQKLYIGNGTFDEGAPTLGRTEILTEHSDILMLADTYTFKGLSSGSQVVTGVDSAHPIVRTLQDKLDDVVSVKDFGAIGDGVQDDTAAIQRALERTYGSSQSTSLLYHHRTINFPAGNYRITGTLNIPPYTRLQGEGKRTTIIQGSFNGPLAQFADGLGQVGVDYGSPVNGITPDTAEYHFNDLSFLQQNTSYNQSCLVIDGCWTATFNRVMFRGLSSLTTADGAANAYDIDRGTGVAAVCANNNSATQGVRNLVFTQCDFMDHNYGIELNYETVGVSVTSCFFDHLYHSIVVGNQSNPITPYGISVYDNYFRWSAAEAIWGGTDAHSIMSLGNLFTAAGLADAESSTPVNNPSALAYTPAITFGAKNCFSIADSFDRSDADYALYPNIETGEFNSYIVGQDSGVVNGRLTEGRGNTLSLSSAGSYTSAGLSYIPANYTNLTVNYTINAASNQRVGSLKVARVGSTFVWDDEYTETADIGVTLQANTSTGDIEYIATASSQLTYNLKFFTA
jgi:hypothetical protein